MSVNMAVLLSLLRLSLRMLTSETFLLISGCYSTVGWQCV